MAEILAQKKAEIEKSRQEYLAPLQAATRPGTVWSGQWSAGADVGAIGLRFIQQSQTGELTGHLFDPDEPETTKAFTGRITLDPANADGWPIRLSMVPESGFPPAGPEDYKGTRGWLQKNDSYLIFLRLDPDQTMTGRTTRRAALMFTLPGHVGKTRPAASTVKKGPQDADTSVAPTTRPDTQPLTQPASEDAAAADQATGSQDGATSKTRPARITEMRPETEPEAEPETDLKSVLKTEPAIETKTEPKAETIPKPETQAQTGPQAAAAQTQEAQALTQTAPQTVSVSAKPVSPDIKTVKPAESAKPSIPIEPATPAQTDLQSVPDLYPATNLEPIPQ
jgi:hypothetical protein